MRKIAKCFLFYFVLMTLTAAVAGCGTNTSSDTVSKDSTLFVTQEVGEQGEGQDSGGSEKGSEKAENTGSDTPGGSAVRPTDSVTADEVSTDSGTTSEDSSGTEETGSEAADNTDSPSVTEASSETADLQDGTADQGTDNSADESEAVTVHVGDSTTMEGLKFAYSASGEVAAEEVTGTVANGYKLVFFKVVCKNISKADEFISSSDFTCYADGIAAEQYFTDDDLSASLSSGRYATGTLIYSVQEAAKDIELTYQCDWAAGEKLTFVYEGTSDSGYVPAAVTKATEGALSVGQVYGTGDLKISYLNCDEFVSENPNIQPAEGNKFVYCEFEFENTSLGDKYISSLDFEGYADGADCQACYGMVNDLSAILISGGSTVGTICFEVPKDAVTIEFEYILDSWNSERVVFSYGS